MVPLHDPSGAVVFPEARPQNPSSLVRSLPRWPFLLIGLFLIAGLLTGYGQNANSHGAAVKRSLDRARALYPQSVQPDSPLSQAILSRIEWLNQNDRAFFSDPDWPLRLTAAEALALGIRPVQSAPRRTAPSQPSGRYLAVVTKNFSTTGASFRKGQQIILESLQDYNKRGTTLVDGQPILLWLDHVKVLRQLPVGETTPVVVKIDSARYGFPGKTAYSVSSMVQSLISPNASGRYEILVSDALLSPSAAQRLNRGVVTGPPFDPYTGQPNPRPVKMLTVIYTIDGVEKTKQALEGQTVILD